MRATKASLAKNAVSAAAGRIDQTMSSIFIMSKSANAALLTLFLYGVASCFPWYTEGVFKGIANDLRLGSSMATVMDRLQASPLIRIEASENGLSQSMVALFIGTTDPPRRIKLRFNDDRLTRREIGDGITDETLASFNWLRSYLFYLLRVALCCAVSLGSFHLLVKKSHFVLRIFAFCGLSAGLLILAVDAIWMLLVYVRYAVLLLG